MFTVRVRGVAPARRVFWVEVGTVPRSSRSLVVVMTGALVVGATPVLAAEPPRAEEIARSTGEVLTRSQQMGRIKGRIAEADAELVRLGGETELALERHNGGLVLLARARKAARAARLRARNAEAAYEAVRREAAGPAAGAYGSTVSSLGRLALMAGGTGGPRGFLDRAGLLQVVTSRHEALMRRLKAARKVSRLLRSEARKARARHRDAVTAAERTRRDALAAVANQKAAFRRIGLLKKDLAARLGRTQTPADLLAERRNKALRARTARRLDRAAVRKIETQVLPRSGGRGKTVVREALKWIGTPYSWGGGTRKGPSRGIAHGAKIRGFDCSGLALYAWGRAGIGLDHWTGSQWASGPQVPTSMLRAGDLVFFAKDKKDPDTIHHVGIFLGEGRMVEAPYTGARVRISSIWRSGLIGAVRPG